MEAPGVGQKGFQYRLINKEEKSLVTFTSSGGDFHDAPRVIAPLTDDEIQLVIPEAVFQDVLDGGTQMFQDQTSNCGAAGAVAQSHLRPRERQI